MTDLAGLLERVKAATGPDRELDAELFAAFPPLPYAMTPDPRWVGRVTFQHGDSGSDSRRSPTYTDSVDAALAFRERVLPGWLWRLASCSVSDDAWVCPDFNHPIFGEAFKKQFKGAFGWRDPAEVITNATDIDRRPAGQPALALIESTLLGVVIHRAHASALISEKANTRASDSRGAIHQVGER